jgi:hypothetical protein
MSNEDTIYKYLGLGVVVVLVIYIGIKTLKFQSNITNTIEPFSTDVLNKLDSTTTDNKNVSNENKLETNVKFLRDYFDSMMKNSNVSIENNFILLEEFLQYAILQRIMAISDKISDNTKINRDFIDTCINDSIKYKSLIDILNSSMTFLDRR